MQELHIQVYWQDCREFAAELRTRWEAFNRGTIKKDTGTADIDRFKMGMSNLVKQKKKPIRFRYSS